jgi:hypothetical protein
VYQASDVIYQCYFRRDQQPKLFSAGPYRGFGLEPDVNENLLRICPELADASTRLALCEYAAFLYFSRRLDEDSDEWIGFTSYRQLDKSHVVFESKLQVEALLEGVDMLAWHGCAVGSIRSRRLSGTAAQSELGHGMHKFTLDMLRPFGIRLPKAYQTAPIAPYASYWILRKSHFAEFMRFSWPIVQAALAAKHPYKEVQSRGYWDDQRKRVGYFAERLFIIWSLRQALNVKWLGDIAPMDYRRPRWKFRHFAFWWRYLHEY